MNKYKSKFESHVASLLRKRKIKFEYESKTFPFVQPAKNRKYTPDFELHDTSTFMECKGKLTQADREKLLWVRETYPNLRLVLLFMRAKNTIRKGSKTTYGDWATANKFEWADWKDGIPEEWTKTK